MKHAVTVNFEPPKAQPPHWLALAHGYRAARNRADDALRKCKSNRPSAAGVDHAYAKGIVAGYEMAVADLRGLIGVETQNYMRDLLAQIGEPE